MTVAAQADVEVIAQPSGEGNVPTSPKIAETDGGIRGVEVVGEGESEAECRANGTGGIAAEVEEDLGGKGECGEPSVESAGVIWVGVNCINNGGKEGVGKDNFGK